MSAVAPGRRVRLHFSVKLTSGEVIDETRGGDPAEFVVGDGSLLPGFEHVLLGLEAGEQRLVVLSPEHAFGEPNPDNVRRLPRSAFGRMELEPGTIVSFAEPSGSELPGVVRRVSDGFVEVDFNHPLSGREILFEASILAVE